VSDKSIAFHNRLYAKIDTSGKGNQAALGIWIIKVKALFIRGSLE
jgi:hypothetical protein